MKNDVFQPKTGKLGPGVGFEPMKLWVQQDGRGLGWESELLEGNVSLGPRSD